MSKCLAKEHNTIINYPSQCSNPECSILSPACINITPLYQSNKRRCLLIKIGAGNYKKNTHTEEVTDLNTIVTNATM